MKKWYALFLTLAMTWVTLAWADNLTLTFEDDSDVANWGYFDETNVWTSAAYDATGGVDGSGALKFTDGGWTFMIKRAVSLTVGKQFELKVSVKTSGWDDAHNLWLKLQGIADDDSVKVNSDGQFTVFTLKGVAQSADGYIKFYGMNGGTASEVWIDNLTLLDGAPESDIVINEIYYNPPSSQGSDDDYEFLELYNRGDHTIYLDGYQFTDGIDHTFGADDSIEAGGYLVLAKNSATYSGSIQWNSGGLKNSGEAVVLKDAAGNTVDSVRFDDWHPWPLTPDGDGASLELTDPNSDNSDAYAWHASSVDGGTPGAVNSPWKVKVHFIANTATVPDTMSKNSVVQVRGSAEPLQWNGTSKVFLKNQGSNDEWGSSDYWYGSAEFDGGQVVYYKFYTNASHDTVYGGCEWEHQGWEADISDQANDRILDLTTANDRDLYLDVQYVNGWAYKPGQYAHPWEDNDSTFVVWLRVNVEGFEDFNPEQHVLGVRGSNNSDWGQTGEISWGKTYLLSPENDHANNGSRQYKGKYFYSGAIHVPNKYKDNGLKWKFVVHYKDHALDEDWGNMFWNPSLEEEIFFNGSGKDTTIYWRWYDRMKPIAKANVDTVIITYRADLTQAIENHGFTPGDTVVVKAGWNKTADQIYTSLPLVKEGLIGNIYTATDTIITTIGDMLQYNFYVIKNGIEYREIYYDFTDEEGGTAAEKRKVEITGSQVTVEDVLADPGELHRMPNFRNLDPITQDLTVIFTVDLRPAYYTVLSGKTLTDIQGNYHVTNADSIFKWGVCINGPATGGWQTWGSTLEHDTTRIMYDDGTHGDAVAGDSIYSITLTFPKGTPKGQEFKFGIRGGDNEGGYGNNHIENLDDSQPITYLHSQFGSIDPLFYDAWDYVNQQPVGITDQGAFAPRTFALLQNYPNPFNPTTRIHFDLPKASRVSLTVYNLLGQKVRTLVDNQYLATGRHQIIWNGRDDQGQKVASGVYFYRIKADKFVATKKMVLMK